MLFKTVKLDTVTHMAVSADGAKSQGLTYFDLHLAYFVEERFEAAFPAGTYRPPPTEFQPKSLEEVKSATHAEPSA
jgi:hypothetical protein